MKIPLCWKLTSLPERVTQQKMWSQPYESNLFFIKAIIMWFILLELLNYFYHNEYTMFLLAL